MRRDLTAAAGAAVLAGALGVGLSTHDSPTPTAGAATSATPVPSTASVTCGALGRVTLELDGTIQQPVATGVRGTSAIHVVAHDTPGAMACTAPKTLPRLVVRVVADGRPRGVPVPSASTPPSEAPPTAVASGGAQDPAGYGPVVACPKDSGVQARLDQQSGEASVAWRPAGSQTIYACSKGSTSFRTASIVKLQIMATAFVQAEQDGRGLSSWEKEQIEPMIRESDNDATTALWEHVGGAEGVAAVMERIGLRSTTPNPGDYWGLTTTTATDQVVLVDHFARPNPIITDALRSYALGLMRSVAEDQDWGITAGPGEGTAVKNGWLPTADEWIVNSTGFSQKSPQPYSIAVLTTATNVSMEGQIDAIQGASRLVWAHTRTHPVTPASLPAAFHGITGDQLFSFPITADGGLGAPVALPGRGWSKAVWFGALTDVDGDGLADLAVLEADGTLWLHRGTTAGGYSRDRRLGTGWGALQLVTAAGDVNADGLPDLLARDATGQLLRYSIPRKGPAVLQGVMGTAFGPIARLLPARIDADARDDLYAVTRTGILRSYLSKGTRLVNGPQVGSQWNQGPSTSSADLTGDRRGDLVLQVKGKLVIYPVLAGGRLGEPVPTAVSATGFRLLG